MIIAIKKKVTLKKLDEMMAEEGFKRKGDEGLIYYSNQGVYYGNIVQTFGELPAKRLSEIRLFHHSVLPSPKAINLRDKNGVCPDYIAYLKNYPFATNST